MLWNTKDVRVAGEGDIKRDGLRTPRLCVGVTTEALVPPCALVFALLLNLWLFLLLLAFFGFLFGLRLDLCSPVLQVQETALVELDLCLAISLELD